MEIVRALEKIVGPKRVSTSEAVRLTYQFNFVLGYDWNMKPDIVVLAETTEEVSQILKEANRHRVPVTPKGAVGGGGLCGPLRGGILLDLTLMDKITLIDKENMKAVAEAGCSFFKLSQEVFKKGMILPTAEYGPGVNVAASALSPSNGFGKTRYGPNIELVEGFEVVLPSGEVAQIGSMAYAHTDFGPFYKYITGPDLTGLFTKSNGAFGVVTKVAYRCVRRPEHWAFHAYHWPLDRIEDVTKALMASTAAEMFDVHLNDKWRWIVEPSWLQFPPEAYFMLFFAVNAENELELKGKEQTVSDICQSYGGTYMPKMAEDFHTVWPAAFCGMSRIMEHPVSYTYFRMLDELIYPASKLPEVYLKIMELAKKYKIWGMEHLPLPIVFDGFPMSPQVMSTQSWVFVDNNDPYWEGQFHKCLDEFREWFGARGGVYQMKLPPLHPDFCWTNQLSDFNLLRSIKKCLDPNDILSPGSFELRGNSPQDPA